MVKSIEELHKIDLDIVKDFKRICDENEFKYYMIGGTLLGAIRHGGFIPWDDDIDIGMPRDDYEKFLLIANDELKKNLKISNFKTNEKYQYYISRIIDLNNPIVEKRIRNNNKNVHASIDIFPIDGTPNNFFIRKLYYFRVMFHRALMSLYYRDSIDKERKRSKTESILVFILEKIPFERIISASHEKNKIDKILKSQSIDKSDNIGTIMGAYRTREIVPKIYFSSGREYKFEDIYLNGPSMYDEYLTHMYGKYMDIPSLDERKSHFEFEEN